MIITATAQFFTAEIFNFNVHVDLASLLRIVPHCSGFYIRTKGAYRQGNSLSDPQLFSRSTRIEVLSPGRWIRLRPELQPYANDEA